MQLKYHQTTYNLLTQTPIDPAKFLETEAEATRCGAPPYPPEATAWCALDLFQRELIVSDEHVRLLDAVEQQYSIKIPASVREWYALDISIDLLFIGYYFGRWPIALEDLGKPLRYGRRNRQVLDDNLLAIVYDPQFGRWCVRLDAGDDPPVVMLLDETSFDKDRSEWKIEEDSPCFSDYLYLYFWDWLNTYTSRYAFNIFAAWEFEFARLAPEYQTPFEKVRTHFAELPQKHGYRFRNPMQRLRIYPAYEGDAPNLIPVERLGSGSFFADNPEALRDLIHRIWGNNPPLKRMTALNNDTEEILETLKQEFAS